MPEELQTCIAMGADVTLMVWADLTGDIDDGNQLRQKDKAKAFGTHRAVRTSVFSDIL
jgi:hypothetical protein